MVERIQNCRPKPYNKREETSSLGCRMLVTNSPARTGTCSKIVNDCRIFGIFWFLENHLLSDLLPVNKYFIYFIYHGVAPEYLSELMVTVAMDVGRRHLRSVAHGDLIIPASRTKTFGPRAFAIAGPQGWNNVAMDLHDSSMSYHEFCSKLKTYLYRQVI